MLKVALLLGLAVVALVTVPAEVDADPQAVQLGSVGASYSFFKGIVVPYTKHVVDGIPAYEVRTIVNGVPHPEEDLLNLRCQLVDKPLVPLDAADRPVYVCRNLNLNKGSNVDEEKIAFLFSADELKANPGKMIDLWIGRTTCRDLMSGVRSQVLDDTNDHVIRVGSIGTKFAHLNGFMVPYTSQVTEDIPAYEFRSLVNGIAKREELLMDFRCALLEDFRVPIESKTRPVYMCRHISTDPICSDCKKTFLLSAEKLNVEPGKKMIDLWLGRTMWHDFLSDVYAITFHGDISSNTVRVGSIGTHFVDLRGVLLQGPERAEGDIPSYELRSIVKGAPVEESDVINFRCYSLDEFFVPVETTSRPVYMCRSKTLLKDAASANEMVFLFSSELLDVPVAAKSFDLWFGRNLWRNFITEVYSRAS